MVAKSHRCCFVQGAHTKIVPLKSDNDFFETFDQKLGCVILFGENPFLP